MARQGIFAEPSSATAPRAQLSAVAIQADRPRQIIIRWNVIHSSCLLAIPTTRERTAVHYNTDGEPWGAWPLVKAKTLGKRVSTAVLGSLYGC